jgi:hypothetical protein
VFREDEFGCFALLSGVFPSVVVQGVWVAVDLEQILMLVGFLGRRKNEKRDKKRRK